MNYLHDMMHGILSSISILNSGLFGKTSKCEFFDFSQKVDTSEFDFKTLLVLEMKSQELSHVLSEKHTTETRGQALHKVN